MFGTAVAALSFLSVNAQDPPKRSAGDRAEMRTEHMVKELGLNDDQAAKVKAINEKYAAKVDEMRKERKEEAGAKKGQWQEVEKARMAELKSVLTPDQYQKLEARQEEMKKERMERREEHKGMEHHDMQGKGAKPAPANTAPAKAPQK